MEEASRLSAILTDFLDFARPRAPHLRIMDVRDVLSRVRDNLGQEMESRSINWINKDNGNNGPIVVKADADLLYQVFLNLAINAFEAIGSDGSITINLYQDSDRTFIEFGDDGGGIKEEDLSNIFTPFFTTHEMGTGLGLSVAHNIIEAHEGEINAMSEPGKGTIFTITLPSGDPTLMDGKEVHLKE